MSIRMRLIDQDARARTLPMRVLVLGMPRTGTSSIYTALTKLGYKPYHMAELIKDLKRSCSLWSEALDAKYYNDGSLKAFGREDFDKVLGDFDAVTDAPCCLFSDELIAAYPNAKIILTTRSPDSWVASLRNTVGVAYHDWKTMRFFAQFDGAFLRPLLPLVDRMRWVISRNDYGDIARQCFLEHNAHVREIVPEYRLLEFEPKDGWQSLCKFLGHDIPNEPYPRANESAEFMLVHTMLYYVAVAKAFLKTSAFIAPVAFGIWYALSRR